MFSLFYDLIIFSKEEKLNLKIKLTLMVLLQSCSSLSFASNKCYLQDQYEAMGWIVHPATEFTKFEHQVDERLKAGLQNQSILVDISGPIVTKNTVNQQETEFMAYMFDDLATNKDEMFGDIAVVEDEQNQRVELRWYQDGFRQIVFNPLVLTCITEPAPVADNSVF